MNLVKYNYVIVFFVILLCILMSKYVLTNLNKETFKVINMYQKKE